MAIKIYKPTTQSRRKMSVVDYSLLTKKSAEKKLTKIIKKAKGRDITGQISTRHKGGGSKSKFRIISSLSDRLDIKADVKAIEYDPNRSSFIALIEYQNKGKDRTYILAWEGIKVGDGIVAKEKGEVKNGNRMLLKNIPTGTSIFEIEIQPGQGGKLVRSAGSQAFLLAKESPLVNIKMASGEIRKINEKCFASLGQVSNVSHSSERIGKAGRRRWQGVRPTVRGKAMHPGAHPHGGGEGVNPIGLKYPKTPWGKHARGTRTRKKNKYSAKFIIQRRKK